MIFERILVWSEVTSVWDGLIRGPTCLGRSDQRWFRARPQPGCNGSRMSLYITILRFALILLSRSEYLSGFLERRLLSFNEFQMRFAFLLQIVVHRLIRRIFGVVYNLPVARNLYRTRNLLDAAACNYFLNINCFWSKASRPLVIKIPS